MYLAIFFSFLSITYASNMWMDLWQNHLNKGLLRSGRFQTAAIISLRDAGAVASSSALSVPVLEGRSWIKFFGSDTYWTTKKEGVKVFGKHYNTVKYDYDRKIVAVDGENGVILTKNKFTIIMATFNYPAHGQEAEKLVDDLTEYIRNLGF